MTLAALVDTREGGSGGVGASCGRGVVRRTISLRPTPADLPEIFGSLLLDGYGLPLPGFAGADAGLGAGAAVVVADSTGFAVLNRRTRSSVISMLLWM